MVQVKLNQRLFKLLLWVCPRLQKCNAIKVKDEYVKCLAGEDVQPKVFDLYVYDLVAAHACTIPWEIYRPDDAVRSRCRFIGAHRAPRTSGITSHLDLRDRYIDAVLGYRQKLLIILLRR